MKRNPPHSEPALEYGGISFNLATRELFRDGRRVPLQPKAFELLALLISEPRRTWTKDEMLAHLWPDEVMGEASLTSCILRIRRGLGRDRAHWIQAQYGVGYRFVGEVSASPEDRRLKPQTTLNGDFFGRSAELEILNRAFKLAQREQPTVVIVRGEPGVGKSALLAQASSDARSHGLSVYRSHASETGRGTAWDPWGSTFAAMAAETELSPRDRDIIRILPGLDGERADGASPVAPTDAPAARFRVFEAARHLIAKRSAQTPLLISFDDLHRADAETLTLLRLIALEFETAGIVWLVTHRPLPPDPPENFEETFGALASAQTHYRLNLEGLDPEAHRSLVDAQCSTPVDESVAASIFEATEGHPLHSVELLRHLVASGAVDANGQRTDRWEERTIPAGLVQMINDHVSQLSSPCRTVLEAAATIGRQFETALLIKTVRAVSNGKNDVGEIQALIDETVAAGVLEEFAAAGDGYRFTHALMRDCVYDTTDPRTRERLHWNVGLLLESHSFAVESDRLVTAARHLVAGMHQGSVEHAIGALLIASHCAESSFSFETAVELQTLALDLQLSLRAANAGPDSAADRLQGETLIRLALLCQRTGRVQETRAHALNAASIARKLKDGELLAEAAVAYESRNYLDPVAESHKAWALLAEAEALLGEGQAALRSRVLACLSRGRLYPSRDGCALDYTTRAIRSAREADDVDALLNALQHHAEVAIVHGEFAQRACAVDEIYSLAIEFDRPDLVAAVHRDRAYDHLYFDQIEDGDREISTMVACNKDLRLPSIDWTAALWTAMRSISVGAFSAAETDVKKAYDVGSSLNEAAATMASWIQTVLLNAVKTDYPPCAEALEAVHSQMPEQELVTTLLGWIHVRRGRHADAHAVCETLISKGPAELRHDSPLLLSLTTAAEVYAKVGDVGRSAELFEILEPHGDCAGMCGTNSITIVGYNPLVYTGSISRTLGLLASTLGRWEAADLYFANAIERHRRSGVVPVVAVSEMDWVWSLLRRDDSASRARAKALIDSAGIVARKLEMPGLLRDIENADRSC